MEAQACGLVGKPEQGLAALDSAMQITSRAGEDILAIDFYRLRGDLLLALSPNNRSEAEMMYLRALDISRKREAAMMGLRAAMRLCRLWQITGNIEEGRRLLRGVYENFTEGFTTADLIEARELLAQLPGQAARRHEG
jgi:predicted ATPase